VSERVSTDHALLLQLNEEPTMPPSSRQDGAKPYENQHTERRDQKLRIWGELGVHFQLIIGDQGKEKEQSLLYFNFLTCNLP
jgi:hypothetical protein